MVSGGGWWGLVGAGVVVVVVGAEWWLQGVKGVPGEEGVKFVDGLTAGTFVE